MNLALQEKKKELIAKRSMSQSATGAVTSTKPSLETLPEDCNVLVINSSREMAKKMTMELSVSLPGCSIIYSPSIELAKWLLKSKKIHLVVSSPILPDGSFSRLSPILETLSSPPNVLVIGNMNIRMAEDLQRTGYEFASYKRMGRKNIERTPQASQLPLLNVNRRIRSLGADIRNDLNNPLQEIVAMVFVAQSGGATELTDQALGAIEQAALSMSEVVNSLEDKIKNAVSN